MLRILGCLSITQPGIYQSKGIFFLLHLTSSKAVIILSFSIHYKS